MFTESPGEDYNVDVVMDSKGTTTPDGHIFEVAVPFKSIRYEAGAGKQWGPPVFRRIKRGAHELNS